MLLGNKDEEVFLGLSPSPTTVCGQEFKDDIDVVVSDFDEIILFDTPLLLGIVDDENGEDEPEQAEGIEATCSLVSGSLLPPLPTLAPPPTLPPLPPPPPIPVGVVDKVAIEADGIAVLLDVSE